MKKKVGIIIGGFVSLLAVGLLVIDIYLFVASDTIELTGIPASDIQEQLDVFVDAGLCWKAYINEDGTAAVIHLTKKQREKWIEWVRDSTNKVLERVNNSDSLEYIMSEDYKVLTLRANENMNYKTAGTYLPALTFDMEMFQVLLGEENWSINFIIEDMDTNEVVYTANFPEEKIKFNEEIWE